MKNPRKSIKLWIYAAIIAIVLPIICIYPPPAAEAAGIDGYLHTEGNKIVDSSGREVHFSGVNWFGFETGNNVVHGLWARNWEEILDDIQRLGYNSIRLPFSNEVLNPGKMPDSIDATKNPDLAGLNSIQIMDKIIEGAGQRGLKVILDNHRSNAGVSAQESGLWYTADYPESRWIADWESLTRKYLNNDTVVAMDLRNEPHAAACWGCGDPATDWRIAAEKAGNAILAINPNLLILVEGNECYAPGGNNDPWTGADCTWWGGNLQGAKDYPVRLNVPNRLVYSPHEYPASVYNQPWFSAPDYPSNLPQVWEKYWGYLKQDYPILFGEFGTHLATESDRLWLNSLADYIRQHGLNWTFWSLNPNSGDTGGLYLNDWKTIEQAKQAVLETIQYPKIGSASPGSGTPAAPEGLSAVSSDQRVALSWTSAGQGASYNVKRSTQSGGPYMMVATVSSNSYADTGLTNGVTYYYVVSAVTTSGESANSRQVAATPQTGATTGDLEVHYRAGNTNPSDNQAAPHFNIVNKGQSSVALSGITLRYWYTPETGKTPVFNCDYAAVGCANVNGKFATAGDGRAYVEISFEPGAGSISAGQQSGDIQLRFHYTDWSNMNESDDYSFNPNQTAYKAYDKVTLYRNGTLIWGNEL
ncbi:cellulase family glycosylhydrolase [Paenibacillus sp. YSY-4.3]